MQRVNLCDVIKQNESELANANFKIYPKIFSLFPIVFTTL